jgi:hypothetical protein
METALQKSVGTHSNPGPAKCRMMLLILFNTSFWKILQYYVEIGNQYLIKRSLFYKVFLIL